MPETSVPRESSNRGQIFAPGTGLFGLPFMSLAPVCSQAASGGGCLRNSVWRASKRPAGVPVAAPLAAIFQSRCDSELGVKEDPRPTEEWLATQEAAELSRHSRL